MMVGIYNSPTGTLKVYDFDNVTGVISNAIPFTGVTAYGVSFSPNSQVLYATIDNPTTSIKSIANYDLTAPNPVGTQTIISPNTDKYFTLQLGPDGRLYSAKDGADHLTVIPNPNNFSNPGFANMGPSLVVANESIASQWGLPNFIDAKDLVGSPDPSFIVARLGDCYTFEVNDCWKHWNMQWDFGDGTVTTNGAEDDLLLGPNPEGTFGNPSYKYTATGSFVVTLTLRNGSEIYNVSKTINVNNNTVNITGPTTVCDDGLGVFYTVPLIPGVTHHWTISGGIFASGGITFTGSSSTVLWNSTGGAITVVSSSGNQICDISSSINVTVKTATADAGEDVTICKDASHQLMELSGANSCSWIPTTGLDDPFICNPIFAPPGEGMYTFTVSSVNINGCVAADQITVEVEGDCVSCDDTLLKYGFGDDCDDNSDDFDPKNAASCISNASSLGPYNGSSGASCLSGVICVESTKNGWVFEISTDEGIKIDHLIANLYYPVNDDTAGGDENNTSCPTLFPYEFTFYINGSLIQTVTGSIPKDVSDLLETISLTNPIMLAAGDILEVKIDGTTNNASCDLFELGGLNVIGCCIICPTVQIDLGEYPIICLDEELTLTATTTGSVNIMSKVEKSTDDAEERTTSGKINLKSSDLEMVEDRRLQMVGIRFNNLDIPQGATITEAYIQFTAEDSDSKPTNLIITGEGTDHALGFSSSKYNISSRPKTSVQTLWSPAPWSKGDAGFDQQTPDLVKIVQEIVNSLSWEIGNSMAFLIEGGGKRVAESHNGSKTKAPQLFVSYSTINNSNFSYQWSDGSVTPSIIISPINSMDFSVTITDDDGCSYSEIVFIEMDEDCCNKEVEVLVDCEFSNNTLTAIMNGKSIDPNKFNIQWIVHDIAFPGSQNPIIVTNEKGHNYSVRVIPLNTSNNKCQYELDGIVTCDK